jgi:NADH-quinone oxidoreductase subunit A
LQAVLAMVIAAALVTLSYVIGRKVKNRVKDMPYECGIAPTGDARHRFSVKFYLVAMLFILFDLEIVFMYPWAVVYRDAIKQSSLIFWSMLSFITILMVGYAYALKKGALDFRK